MQKKRKIAKRSAPRLSGERLALLRLDAVRIAANLPEGEQHGSNSLQGGFHNRPGKSADKVVIDAGKLIAFITGR